MAYKPQDLPTKANWGTFYRKYLVSQAETKYDRALSIDTKKRSSAYTNRTPRALAPSTRTLHRPAAGTATTYTK